MKVAVHKICILISNFIDHSSETLVGTGVIVSDYAFHGKSHPTRLRNQHLRDRIMFWSSTVGSKIIDLSKVNDCVKINADNHMFF